MPSRAYRALWLGLRVIQSDWDNADRSGRRILNWTVFGVALMIMLEGPAWGAAYLLAQIGILYWRCYVFLRREEESDPEK